MDGMDLADRSLLRAAGLHARDDDLARDRLSRGGRVGVLRIPTTRGDRLFVSLVLAAVIHLLWIGLVGTDPIFTLPIGEGVEISSLWLGTVISLLSAVVIFRTV